MNIDKLASLNPINPNQKGKDPKGSAAEKADFTKALNDAFDAKSNEGTKKGILNGKVVENPEALKAGLEKAKLGQASEEKKELGIKFSNHAVDRMRSRGIHFAPKTLESIDSAITKAEQKGAKETLVIADSSAMIVNVENKTVVTVMDKGMLKENIFTNIDAAVIV